MRRVLVAGFLAAAGSLASAPAQARSVQDERYNYDVIWNAAVRLIRVDLGFAITERDRDSGFVMFTYRDNGRSAPGSIEFVHTTVDGVSGARVIVQISDMPSYVERYVLNRLERKLRDEYGDPPPPVHHDPNAHEPPPHDGDGDDHDADAGHAAPPHADDSSRDDHASRGQ